jgi:S1-C subfamily serine protease
MGRWVLLTGCVFWSAGCGGATPGLRGDVAELRALHAQEQVKLDAIRAEISAAEVRAGEAQREAAFSECRAQVAGVEAAVAGAAAECARRVAAYNACRAENEARAAKSGLLGCVFGIGAAALSGGAAAPLALSGCGLGVAVGSASASECDEVPSCATEPDHVTPILQERGLEVVPMCGGRLGVAVRPRQSEADAGLEIVTVGSVRTTAAGLGLQPGDVLLSLANRATQTAHALNQALQQMSDADPVEAEVVRNGWRIRLQGQARSVTFDGRTARRVELGASTRAIREPVRYRDGLEVVHVKDGSAAHEASVIAGDVLVTVNDQLQPTESALRFTLSAVSAGASVELGVLTNGRPRTVSVVLGPREEPDAI